MIPPTRFQTGRLLLRAPVLEDVSALFDGYCQDGEVTRYLMWKPHSCIQETQEFVEHCIEEWKSNGEFSWTISPQESRVPIGMISARRKDHLVELGYVLARKFWNRGIMQEASRTVMDWWFGQREIFRVQAFCDVGNTASARVLEKIGMIREGLLRRWGVHPNISQTPRDCILYAKTR